MSIGPRGRFFYQLGERDYLVGRLNPIRTTDLGNNRLFPLTEPGWLHVGRVPGQGVVVVDYATLSAWYPRGRDGLKVGFFQLGGGVPVKL